jgi:putative Mn2+ efflux pump MntP
LPQTFSFGRLWPVILIVIGVVKIVESLQKQKQKKDEPSEKDQS